MYFEILEVTLPTVEELLKYTEKFSHICEKVSINVCKNWWVWSKQGKAVLLNYENSCLWYPINKEEGSVIPLLRLEYEKGSIIADEGIYVNLFNQHWAVFTTSSTEALAFCINFKAFGAPPIVFIGFDKAEQAVKNWFNDLITNYIEE